MTIKANFNHPAKFSEAILKVLAKVLHDEWAASESSTEVLDPMAGVGGVHSLALPKAIKTIGVEIEPEWAACHPNTICGDATALPEEWSGRFDVTLSSWDYGNRMADAHDNRDRYPEGHKRAGQLTKRIGYKFSLGRNLSPGNIVRPWGNEYRILHAKVLREMIRVTRPGGLVVLNLSNFIKNGQEVNVIGWAEEWLRGLGLKCEQVIEVKTPRMRFGQNHGARVEHERVLCYRKPT